MKGYMVALCALFVLVMGFPSEACATKGKKAQVAATPPLEMLDNAVMGKLMELSQPTQQDRLLSTLSGTWYYEIRFWSKEGDAPQVSSGLATNKMILGGRYLLSEIGLNLNIGGQSIPYGRWSLLGYDTTRKAYTSVWADSFHTGIITGHGEYNKKKNSIEENVSATNPLNGKQDSYRSVLQFVGSGTYKRTIYKVKKSGKDFKMIEVTFERR